MANRMRFWVASRGEARKASPRSQLVLSTDNWDDYGHRVTFHLRYFNADGHESEIGSIKILQCSSPPGRTADVPGAA